MDPFSGSFRRLACCLGSGVWPPLCFSDVWGILVCVCAPFDMVGVVSGGFLGCSGGSEGVSCLDGMTPLLYSF